jgi:hypothetical protein
MARICASAQYPCAAAGLASESPARHLRKTERVKEGAERFDDSGLDRLQSRRTFIGAAAAAIGAAAVARPEAVAHAATIGPGDGGERLALASRAAPAPGAAEVIYSNPLATPTDVADFRLEGDATVSFPEGRMRFAANRDPSEGQAANFVFWCPRELPDRVRISWNFWQLREPGLCILFFAARGRGGEDLFDPRLSTRTGDYQQYHSGDIDALHLSYFRRRYADERAFHTCNLRKSHGFHLVAQGADPLPPVEDATPPYRIELIKDGPRVAFAINELPLLDWTDDGTHGPTLAGGKIGFRQMAPLVAEYSDLVITGLD